METRERFGSRLGFVLVSAGCAIGLGNVWKFPYMAGKYGGAAFILIYLFFLLIIGLPILICEFSLGRNSQRSIATAFAKLEPEGTNWHKLKSFGMAGNYLLVMFYSMVGGWMLNYCFQLAKGDYVGASSAKISEGFTQMLSSPGTLFFWTILAIVISFGVCCIGVQKGVERVTKIMMLCLLVLIVILAINSIMLPGAKEGIRFYLVPDFGKIHSMGWGNVIFAAMSQAFFTLSIGMGGMAIFGSYLEKDRSLAGESLQVLVLDTFVALMAGLIVIPACFAYHIEPTAGPSLIFIALPNIFARMPGGQIWGFLFFLFLSFAALSTIIGVFENIVSFGVDLKGWSRKKSVGINMAAVTVLSIPCILGFNLLSFIEPLGTGTNLMDLEDFLVSSNVLPLGSVIFLLFCTHKNGWGWDNFIKETNAGKGLKFPTWIRFYMTNILPLIVVVIYIKGYYDLFKNQGSVLFLFWMSVAFLILGFIFSTISSRKREKRLCQT
ncbi:MAG: sodium-dependent transporter [Anaerostipes sp.]|jgi:NSS family neurotransmitter:Na+ symporter|nr:sodium-dependent transporter [Anaerostipes sp.]MDD3745970.1 sodium-dependent transporter [Anaerostipes sp.]